MTEAKPPAKLGDFCRRILISEDHHKQAKVLSQEMSAALDAVVKSFELPQFPIIRLPPMPTLKILETLQANRFTSLSSSLSFFDSLGPTWSSATLETSPQVEELKHSPDYATVVWQGDHYLFNKNQAICVRLLHEAWLKGTPYLSGHHLLGKIEGAVKMSGLFRCHPAWKCLIVPGERRATYRLNLSPQ